MRWSGRRDGSHAFRGQNRLRPILMTSFAFILGCVLLAIASGSGAYSRNIIGIVGIAGMTMATVVGIFPIPFFYFIMKLFRVRIARKTVETDDPDEIIARKHLFMKPMNHGRLTTPLTTFKTHIRICDRINISRLILLDRRDGFLLHDGPRLQTGGHAHARGIQGSPRGDGIHCGPSLVESFQKQGPSGPPDGHLQ
ncbi:MAG: efflux RND transporter permease subunit [Akkermansia muciniphila]